MVSTLTDTPVGEGMSAGTESFAALLEESLGESTSFEGQVVRGTVVRIENDAAVIDVGLKSEGRIAIKEFALRDKVPN